MRRHASFALLLALLLSSFACAKVAPAPAAPAAPSPAAAAAQPQSATRFENEIANYEKQDQQTPPPATPTLFIGSSTFTRWKAIPAEFKEFTAINRGFGGSTIADILYYADRMIIAYKPKTVVLYAGTNDIAAGASPEKVEANFEDLAQRIHAALPETQIYFISAIPSPSRVKFIGGMDDLNARAQKYTAQQAYLHYIDARFVLSDQEKQPDPTLYISDRLHPNQQGYNRLIPVIRAALGPPAPSIPAH